LRLKNELYKNNLKIKLKVFAKPTPGACRQPVKIVGYTPGGLYSWRSLPVRKN